MNNSDMLQNRKYQKIVADIDKEVDYVNIKSHSHNIISVALKQAAVEFGIDAANDLIKEFDLETLGWEKINPEGDI